MWSVTLLRCITKMANEITMPDSIWHCYMLTAMTNTMRQTHASGVVVNHYFTEEPCAGKLASTVLKQRREERFSFRL